MLEVATELREPPPFRASMRTPLVDLPPRRMPAWIPPLGLGLYMVAAIWYWLPSGYPQPADGFMLGLVVVALIGCWRGIPAATHLYAALAGFCAWVILVNLVWFCLRAFQAHDLDWAFPRKTAFYLFNSVVMLFVVWVGCHDWQRTRHVVRAACLTGLFLQAVYLWFNPPIIDETGLRSVGTFHNPNQLGYWALLIMACLAVVKERTPLTALDFAGLAAGMYALAASLSKAASISGAVLIAVILVCCGVSRRSLTSLALASAMIIAGAALTGVPLLEKLNGLATIAALQHRLEGLGGQADDNLAQRGYIRMALWPEYLLLGAGEGAFVRFRDEHGSNEFHSTLGNIAFSYGIVGIGLFGVLLVVIFRHAPWRSWAYFVPVMLYGLTHMGLRFSEFWIFLGLVYAQAHFSRKEPCAQKSETPKNDRTTCLNRPASLQR